MKRLTVKIALLLIICLNLLPLTVMAAGDGLPPAMPYEKVATKKGAWYTTQLSYGGEAQLVVGYKGSYKDEAKKPEMTFTLAEKTLLTGIFIPYAGMDAGKVTLTLEDSQGNQYQSFMAIAERTGGISETDKDIMLRQAANTANTIYTFTPQDNIFLPKGGYTLYLDGDALPVNAFLLKGYNYTAYQKYLEELQKWAGEEEQGDSKKDKAGKDTATEETAAKGKEAAETAIAGKDTIIIDKEPFAIMENEEIPVPLNFTGTYKIWLDLYKTRTLMGPVNSKESSFSLEDHELSVLDKGSVIELVGQYEGIPFSQNCEVTDRDENKVTAKFDFSADLTKLPYKAKIAAIAEVTLTRGNAGRVDIAMAGQGFYSRAATKDKGADENTYSLTMRGNRVKKDLPLFVMAAISKAYGAGNIPGPDSPAQAAAGMIFPPLVGLVVSVLQGLLKPKGQISAAGDGLPTKLSVGEQAMKDANRSLGKGLYTEEEARAWSMLGDALGASGGDAEDAVSIGDNERPGGAEYAATQESSFGGADDYDSQDYESEEDLSFGKPDVPPESQAAPLEQPEQPLAAAEPETMVLQTSVRGATSLYIKDPQTGQWVNAETGGVLDTEKYQEAMERASRTVNAQQARDAELERTGQTAQQQAMNEIEKNRQADIAEIQNEMDKRRREQLQQDQERLEWEQERAQSMNSWGRILGDTVKGSGDDLAELGKAAKAELEITAEALIMTGRDLFNPEQAMKNINESYEDATNVLGAVQDKVMDVAVDISENPWKYAKGAAIGAMKISAGVIQTVTSPQKAWAALKDFSGLEDFEKSLDPNLSVIDRMKHTLTGTVKLGGFIATAGQAGAAVKGAGKMLGPADDVLGAGGKSLVAKAPVQGIKPTLAVKTGPNYATVNQSSNLVGVSKTAQKVVQNVADDMGLQIKTRSIKSANAGKMIESGQAVPKRVNMKAKTLTLQDEMLGGPKNAEGLVGYYEPKLPPKDVWNTLSQKTKAELADLYKTRRREFKNLAGDMKELQTAGEYTLENGLVKDLKQGGKAVTSDWDIHDITNFDGSAVSESVKKEAYQRMMKYGGKTPVQSTVMHEGTMSWTKQSDPLHFSEAAKQKLITGATKEGPGKGIISINPLAKPTAEKYVR